MGCIGKVRVTVSKYDKKAFMTEPGSREWVSLIGCVSLDGRQMRPWIIFKGKLHQKFWLHCIPMLILLYRITGGLIMKSGWNGLKCVLSQKLDAMTSTGCWFWTATARTLPHRSFDSVWLRKSFRYVFLRIPPITSSLFQPLDVGIFAPLATAYKSDVRERSKFIVSYLIDKVDFLEINRTARDQAITSENKQKAWKASGLDVRTPMGRIHESQGLKRWAIPTRPKDHDSRLR